MKQIIIDSKLDKSNDECGVFGLYKNNDDIDGISIAHDALYGLQHRGQDSAGIAVNIGGEFKCVKNLGMVANVFTEKALEDLEDGKIVIGHVRFTPSGLVDKAGTQPLVLKYIKGSLGICHNGAISNLAEIRNDLEQGGAIFQSYSNAELIAYIIAAERLKSNSIENAVKKTMKRLQGAYSLVISAPSKLIGVRDPHGFRPLCIGKLKDSYMISSESCVFNGVGAEFVRDVEPGEMVVIDETGLHSYKVKTEAKTSFCMFEYVYIARPDSVINGVSVHMARKQAGALLYKEHPVEADMVCGVPDSGLDAAQGFAMESGIPYGIGFVKNKYLSRMPSGKQQDKKQRLLNTKLTALTASVKDKRIVIIDDSIVRGETSAHIVKLLKDAGAKEVHMRISSPSFLYPCYFGVDIKQKEELIANRMQVDEICKSIGADSLGYLSIDGLKQIARESNTGYCDACFSGNYTAPIPAMEYIDKFSQKIN